MLLVMSHCRPPYTPSYIVLIHLVMSRVSSSLYSSLSLVAVSRMELRPRTRAEVVYVDNRDVTSLSSFCAWWCLHDCTPRKERSTPPYHHHLAKTASCIELYSVIIKKNMAASLIYFYSNPIHVSKSFQLEEFCFMLTMREVCNQG